MSTMTKVLIVLTVVVAIVHAILSVAGAARWTNSQESLEAYQQIAQSEMVRRMNLEAVMAATLAMKDDDLQAKADALGKSQQQVRQLQDQVASLRNELARRTNEAVAFEAGRKKLEEILDVQTAELNALQKNYQQLFDEKITLQTQNQRLASRNLELTSDLTIATDETRNLQEKLYAAEQRIKNLQQAQASGQRIAPDVESPQGVQAVSPAVAGPILGEVQNVDGGYVTISVGEASGVIEGMTFMIYRDQTYIGDLAVETVRPKAAGGRLTLVRSGREVAAGDRVVYGLEGS